MRQVKILKHELNWEQDIEGVFMYDNKFYCSLAIGTSVIPGGQGYRAGDYLEEEKTQDARVKQEL